MGVYLSAPADADLNVIYRYLYDRSPQNAAAFLRRFEEAIDRIDRSPRANRVRDELPAADLRFARADPAFLVYRICENGDCEVVRVVHKAQNIAALFDTTDED